jgi:hypothetical protein
MRVLAAAIRYCWDEFHLWFLVIVAAFVAVLGVEFLAPRIVSAFGFGETGEAVVYGGLLLGLLAAQGWLYDRYRLWRLCREQVWTCDNHNRCAVGSRHGVPMRRLMRPLALD